MADRNSRGYAPSSLSGRYLRSGQFRHGLRHGSVLRCQSSLLRFARNSLCMQAQSILAPACYFGISIPVRLRNLFWPQRSYILSLCGHLPGPGVGINAGHPTAAPASLLKSHSSQPLHCYAHDRATSIATSLSAFLLWRQASS